MKYIVDISQRLRESVERVLSNSEYKDFNSFFVTAIENQILLEETERSNIENEQDTTKVQPRFSPKDILYKLTVDSLSGKINTMSDLAMNKVVQGPLWGGFYKIFPAKLSLRVILSMSGSNGILIKDCSKRIIDYAVSIGSYLRDVDKVEGRKHGDKVSVAFPFDDQRSIKRFLSQYFLSFRPSDGRLDGLLPRMHFVSTEGDRVGVTAQGLSFAKINNPMIDSASAYPSLSEEEISFLAKHIRMNMPDEYNDITHLLYFLRESEKSRDQIFEDMGRYYSKYSKGKKWTLGMIGTMASGMLSRLLEMNAVEKIKGNKYVQYRATERSALFLTE